ncbi:MAG: hypothetical protein EBS34_03870 [Flavobacteriales bacterium]|nr:hypothetical protein [Flavobacteriales bacterium]
MLKIRANNFILFFLSRRIDFQIVALNIKILFSDHICKLFFYLKIAYYRTRPTITYQFDKEKLNALKPTHEREFFATPE